MRAIVIALAAVAAIQCGPACAADMGWSYYGNARFGYSICYPAPQMRPRPESQNGDGREFVAADGAKLLAWGSNDALEEGLKGEMTYFRNDLARDNAKIVYTANGSNWSVISGATASTIYYQKSFFRDGQLLSFRLSYPVKLRARYDSVAAKISKCFRPGTAAY